MHNLRFAPRREGLQRRAGLPLGFNRLSASRDVELGGNLGRCADCPQYANDAKQDRVGHAFVHSCQVPVGAHIAEVKSPSVQGAPSADHDSLVFDQIEVDQPERFCVLSGRSPDCRSGSQASR